MRRYDLTAAEAISLASQTPGIDDLVDATGTLIVIGEADHQAGIAVAPHHLERVAALPAVVVGISSASDLSRSTVAPLCDVVVAPGEDALAALSDTLDGHPHAATALAILLRGAASRSLGEGLAAESAVYSTLQAGPEFAAWRRSHPPRRREQSSDPVVRMARHGDRLDVTLSRPDVRNAYSMAMRDQLYDALTLAAADPSLQVHLRGEGAAFCAGGDLDEFGTLPDPATAHLVRLVRSVGRLLASIAERVTAHLHGACVGSGIELPAFAGHVVAQPNTTIGLPEVRLGLIPGAGGTISLTRRIGRHRAARLALTHATIDAQTALAWGLVDKIES